LRNKPEVSRENAWLQLEALVTTVDEARAMLGQRFADTAWRSQLNVHRRVLGYVRGEPGLAIDVGCGLGALSLHLALSHPSTRVIGLDTDHHALMEAREIQQSWNDRRAGLVAADARMLPLPDSSVDLALAVSLLHWLHPRQDQGISEFARVLRPGGQLIICGMLRGRTGGDFLSGLDAFVAESAERVGVSRAEIPRFAPMNLTIEQLRYRVSDAFKSEAEVLWERRRSFTPGDDVVSFLDRTMRDFYWRRLDVNASRRLRDELRASADTIGRELLTLPTSSVLLSASRR
jgi:SAM-dependent methyltransferase